MKRLYIFIAISFLLNPCAYAEGVKFIKENKPRYVESLDKKVGIVVKDTILKLEYTKCLVGMDSSSNSRECTGTPETLTWHDADAFSRQVGGGWRLPTQDEFKTYLENRREFKSLLNKYGYKLFDGTPYWTIEQSKESNVHGAVAYRPENDEINLVIRRDTHELAFVFVRKTK